MKRTILSIVVVAAAVAVSAQIAAAQPPTSEATSVSTADQYLNWDLMMSIDLEPTKKCSFNSDCPHGKCKGGKCGACGFDSECKGWGKCKGGQCGACGFDSECKGFGKCSGGKCTKKPKDY